METRLQFTFSNLALTVSDGKIQSLSLHTSAAWWRLVLSCPNVVGSSSNFTWFSDVFVMTDVTKKEKKATSSRSRLSLFVELRPKKKQKTLLLMELVGFLVHLLDF